MCGDAGREAQGAEVGGVVAGAGEVLGGAIAGAVADGDGAGGRGAQAHGELGVAICLADDEMGNGQKVGHVSL